MKAVYQGREIPWPVALKALLVDEDEAVARSSVVPARARGIGAPLAQAVHEVVREALRLLQEHDAVQAAELEALREEIQAGRASPDRGEGQSMDVSAIKARARQAQPQS